MRKKLIDFLANRVINSQNVHPINGAPCITHILYKIHLTINHKLFFYYFITIEYILGMFVDVSKRRQENNVRKTKL